MPEMPMLRTVKFAATLAIIVTATLQPASAQTPAQVMLSADQVHEDVAAFEKDFMARDNAFSKEARAAAEARLKALAASTSGMRAVDFELALAQIVALADNGHTLLAAGVRVRHYNRVPLRFTVFGEELYVVRASGANADLLGSELVSVDGHPYPELRDKARTLAGGTNAWRDRTASYFIESPEQMNALGMAREFAAATYSLRKPDGRIVTRRLNAEPPDSNSPRVGADRWVYPDLLPSETGWHTLLQPANAPWALQEPGEPFRWRVDKDLDALVIGMRQVRDAPGHSIREFLTQMTDKIKTEHPRNLVLDVRLNGGGNLQTARDFVKSLPSLVPGRIYVLTSPYTFSAAISTVGYLKQAAPERVIIVGEHAGDRLTFFAEGQVVTLKNSGAILLFATERHDYENGCATFTDCHRPVVQFPIAIKTLEPEIPAPWTVEAYRASRDPGMEAIRSLQREIH